MKHLSPFFFLFLAILLATILQYPNAALATTSQNDNQQFPPSIIAASSTDTTPHALKLKAIQQGDAEPKRVSGFKVDLTNVITAQINSQVLVFVTDSSVKVIEAKVRTVLDQLIDLIPSATSQANAFSLTNLPVGVYTLDVITQKENTRAAYEGILVLGQQPTNPQTKTIIERQIIREERDNGDGDNGDNGDDCDPSYPGTCIRSPPPDLDCGDNGVPNNLKVLPPDPHDFDREGDGIGCESTGSSGGPDPCIENPDSQECQVDCEENPDAEECQVDCEENPDAEECQVDCEENPDAEECQVDCEENPDAEECQVDCEENPDAEECQVDCEENPDAEECEPTASEDERLVAEEVEEEEEVEEVEEVEEESNGEENTESDDGEE